MARTTGFAAYAAGVAMLGEGDEVVDELVTLAEGDPRHLQDARSLLTSTRADPRRVERASRFLDRAIERIDQNADHIGPPHAAAQDDTMPLQRVEPWHTGPLPWPR